MKRWFIASIKTVWLPYSGYAAYSSQFLCPGVATQCPGSKTLDGAIYTASKSKILQHRSTSLLEILVGTNVAVQDHRTRLWDTYGIMIAIGPQCQSHIKAQKGPVLVQNRCFIRCRVPELVPYLQCNAQCTRDLEATNQCTSEP